MQSVFGYDAEGDADHAVLVYLQDHREKGWDRWTGMSRGLEEKWTGWYLPREEVGRIRNSRGSKF